MATDQLDIWTFNLRTEFCDEVDGPNGWSLRRSQVAELIRTRRPALVCCQEATQAMLAFLASELGHYDWVGNSRFPGKADETAGLLFDRNRLKLVEHSTRWLGPPGALHGQPGWDAAFPRTFEKAVFEVLGLGSRARFCALSTHLDHVGVQARHHSAELLAAALGEQPKCAQVLCGDFNSPKGGNRVYDLLTLAGLGDVAREAPFRSLARSTIHKFQGVEFSELRGDGSVDLADALPEGPAALIAEDAQHIDWVLWRNGPGLQLRPLRCEVVTDCLPSGRYPSDHFPVSATFALHPEKLPASRL